LQKLGILVSDMALLSIDCFVSESVSSFFIFFNAEMK